MPDPKPQAVPDRISIALGALGAGASWGAAVVVLGLLLFRSWQVSGAPLPTNVPLLSGPLMTGLVSGVAVAWWLSRPIADPWRQTMASALTIFGTAMLAALAAPADAAGGRIGLAIYAAMLGASGWSAARRARRAAAPT